MKFKLVLAALLLTVFSSGTFALPNEFNVYSSQVSGGKDTICRAVFKIYAEEHKATPTFVIKQGAAGLIAMEEMLKDKRFSVFCSGPSESVFNNVLYPGHEKSHEELTMITPLMVSADTFYTGPDNKFNVLTDLIKSGKPIKVGHHTTGGKIVGLLTFGNLPVTWVPYKNALDATPSLTDGTLDVYIDSGSQGMESLVKAGKLKSLGKINGNAQISGQDITNSFLEAAKIHLFVALTTSKNNDPSDIEEMNKRLKAILQRKEIIDLIYSMGATPIWQSVEDSNNMIRFFREKFKSYQSLL